MSTEFSESEMLVLGALACAADDEATYFYAHASDIFSKLGLWRVPDTEPSDEQPIERVPDDIVWGTAEPPGQSSVLTAEHFAKMQSQMAADLEEANKFFDGHDFPTVAMAEQMQKAVSTYAESVWLALGFAASTPNCVYGLKRNGRLYVAKRVETLPAGLIRLVLAHVSPFSAIPLGWLMALPDVCSSLPEESLTHVVPSIETGEFVVGEEQPAERRAAMAKLVGAESASTAYALGMALWALHTGCEHFIGSEDEDSKNRSAEHGDDGQPKQAADTPTEEAALPDTAPQILKEVFALSAFVSSGQREWSEDDWKRHVGRKREKLKALMSVAAHAGSLAGHLHMAQVEVLLGEVHDRLSNRANAVDAFAAINEWSFFWVETCTKVENALCIAYGDLLLRERHTPDPIPTAKAKSGLLRQPERIRAYLNAAVGHLKRDAPQGHNHALALSILGLVLEPLSKQAAELYLRHSRSTKVADLLFDLLEESKKRPSPEGDEMEVVARFGIALHHGMRNDAVHNIADLAGDWESAQFFAFGLLSILNVLERARQRTG